MEKKMKKMNDKGFSLVELIIVIAIMAVLVGILAPQYLKYVQRSRVSTDITNAEEIANAINVAIADGMTTAQLTTAGIATGSEISGNTAISGLDGFTTMPTSRCNSSYVWVVNYDDTNGVNSITLGASGSSVQIYPDATAFHGVND